MASEFERTNKPREIEEWLDTYVWRRLGYLLITWLRNTPVTPNMLSVASALAAMACAWAYYYRSLEGALAGTLLMIVHSVFDAADGQLARLKGTSKVGRMVDGVSDGVSFTAIHVGVLLSYARYEGAWLPGVAVLAAAALASHQVQCGLVEHRRQLFWYYCYGNDLPSREKPELLAGQMTTARGVERLFLALQLGYATEQRRLLPSGDRLQRAYEAAVASDPIVRERFAATYRARNTELVRYWAVLAPNSHKLAIVATAFLPVIFESGSLHQLGQVACFVYNIALTIPMAGLVWFQRKVDRELLATLPAGSSSPWVTSGATSSTPGAMR